MSNEKNDYYINNNSNVELNNSSKIDLNKKSFDKIAEEVVNNDIIKEDSPISREALGSDGEYFTILPETALDRAQKHLNNNLLFRRINTPLWYIFTVIFAIYFVMTFFLSNVLTVNLPVNGTSMYPTLNVEYTEKNDDTCLDVVYIYKTKKIEKQDIIVFESIKYTRVDSLYIKRAIATNGDTVCFVKNGSTVYDKTISEYVSDYDIYVNGEILTENYINGPMKMIVGYPNVTDSIIASSFYKDLIKGKTITVPDNSVFAMGDNRMISNDCRYFGFVSLDDVWGKVVVHVESGHTVFYGIYTSIKNGYLFN